MEGRGFLRGLEHMSGVRISGLVPPASCKSQSDQSGLFLSIFCQDEDQTVRFPLKGGRRLRISTISCDCILHG